MTSSPIMMISWAVSFILLLSIIRISLFRCGCIWSARFLNSVHCLRRLITCSKAQLWLLI
ncbi:hypothetical protein BDW71DRAFT_17552 [Aspergillus fruticulosus]